MVLYTNHFRFTFMDIHKTLIKMVNSKKIRVSNKGTRVPLLKPRMFCGMCIHDNMTIINIFCDNMTTIHY